MRVVRERRLFGDCNNHVRVTMVLSAGTCGAVLRVVGGDAVVGFVAGIENGITSWSCEGEGGEENKCLEGNFEKHVKQESEDQI